MSPFIRGDLAAVGPEALAEPHHGADLDRRRTPGLLDDARFGRKTVVVHRAQQLDPVGPARLGPLRVRRVERDHLKHTHGPILPESHLPAELTRRARLQGFTRIGAQRA